MNVPDELRNAASLYEERNKLYGDNYKYIGTVAMSMFPKGLELKTAEDFNRFGTFWAILVKMTRYAEMYSKGGHADSLDDITVYSQMMKELDALYRATASGPPSVAPFRSSEGEGYIGKALKAAGYDPDELP
jgi:hypothetical protein